MSTTTQTVAHDSTEAATTTTATAPRVGPWRLDKKLGHGGQGSTWLARHTESGLIAAVKRFRVADMAEWKRLELFEREAATLAALEHPAIPRFYGVGESDDGTERWIAMELIDGEPLSARIGIPAAPAELARIFSQALDVLGYLHTRVRPVLHRDLKPHNLVVRRDGRLAVVDFGSVRTALMPEGGSTVVGTFGYLAPEQLHGAVQPSSDLYSLGVTMIALAAGLDGSALPRKGLKIDVDRVLRDFPDRRLAAAWAQMVEPDPNPRPKDVAAVRALLSPKPAPSPAPEPGKARPFIPPPPLGWRPRGPLGKLIMMLVALWLGVVFWIAMPIGRFILSRAHERARRRVERRHWRNEPRLQAELAHVETRFNLQRLRLEQAKQRVDQWRHHHRERHPAASGRHGRGRIPRGRRA